MFCPLAFWGVLSPADLPPMMLAQVSAKTIYEIVVLPVTARVVATRKKTEGMDVYDSDVSYSIWRIGDLG